jgi:hypothetical protein
MNGKWVVSIRDDVGEWWGLEGVYETPSPSDGGTAEQVLREEQEAALRADGREYGEMRAEWVRMPGRR